MLLRSRQLSAALQKDLAFLVERPVEWRTGQEIALDFAPTMTRLYKAGLFFPKGVKPPTKEMAYVQCSIYVDGRLLTDGAGPRWTSVVTNADGTQAELCFFPGIVGAAYHISLRVEHAAAGLDLKNTRLIVAPDPHILGEREWDALLTGGTGVTLWLAAYGVFVAAAIRVALNRRDAADRRAFPAGQPPS